MNQKGFTLMEILAVVVIVSLIFIIIVPTIINSLDNSKEKTIKTQEQIIFGAAENYINDNKIRYPNGATYIIYLHELIENGYLNENLKDITNNKPFNSTAYISVEIYNNTKHYEFYKNS